MSETGPETEFDPKLVALRDRLSKAANCDMPCACLWNPQPQCNDCGSLAHELFAELTRLQQANAALVEERNALAHDLALVQTRKHKADIALAEFIEATAGDYDGWILWKIAEARKTALASQ